VLCKEEYCERLDASVFPGVQGGPLMHVIAAKAVCFKEAMAPEFKEYQQTVTENARALCGKMASEGYRIVSGGTETHLFMIDLRNNGISGREAQDVLESVGINVNMNEIPYDETPPTVTSGIRLGTPAVTTRGMRPEHMEILGALISRALKNKDEEGVLDRVRSEARDLIGGFPLY
jgi:glycine hydroxymethyltransferase